MSQRTRVCTIRIACLVLAALFLAGGASWLGFGGISTAQAAGAPSITSDKPDYHPGETVTLTGSGWQPGELVTVGMVVAPLTHAACVL